ncbi:hypothetical protein ACUW6B_000463 [Staphylococcus hominis]
MTERIDLFIYVSIVIASLIDRLMSFLSNLVKYHQPNK